MSAHNEIEDATKIFWDGESGVYRIFTEDGKEIKNIVSTHVTAVFDEVVRCTVEFHCRIVNEQPECPPN